ncbi:MAG: bis(5'-nucleosyl)-tetraphosphatase (symmetrical) [Polaromonas sp.]|nr:bis(5'-nucleosyl)-tetraphosphatase (symmetrical) [Polaromonas sp.]
MALYMIGDVQGCMGPLRQLLDKLGFSASRDTVYLLGDLVNRGPDSLGVLRWAHAAGSSARCLLGNHDLHLLAVAHGVRKAHRQDTLGPVLQAPDAPELLHWLRRQPLARLAHGWLMVHAGVLPSWTAEKTIALSSEFESAIGGFDHKNFLQVMYGNQPNHWREDWPAHDRLRVVVNALTRLRFCTPDGHMEFDAKDSEATPPPGHLPWFDVPGRLTAGQPVAFGHWSTLRDLQRPNVLALDTGCVWGGCLTAAEIRPAGPGQPAQAAPLISVNCPQAQRPTPKPV